MDSDEMRTIRKSRRIAQKRRGQRGRKQTRFSVGDALGVDASERNESRNLSEARAMSDARAAAEAKDRSERGEATRTTDPRSKGKSLCTTFSS